jgi:hypothetical protein
MNGLDNETRRLISIDYTTRFDVVRRVVEVKRRTIFSLILKPEPCDVGANDYCFENYYI